MLRRTGVKGTSNHAGKVLCPQEEKLVYSFTAYSEKTNVTTLVTGNAADVFAPPIIIYKYKRIPKNVLDRIQENWEIGKLDGCVAVSFVNILRMFSIRG